MEKEGSLTILFIILAAFCKACADTMADHYDTSVFRKLNPKFWDKPEAAKYAKFLPGTKYRWDGWHIANSLQIFFWMLAVVLHVTYLHWLVEWCIGGVIFIVVFNLFYNKILRT